MGDLWQLGPVDQYWSLMDLRARWPERFTLV